jgi:alpha-soluble NSF attachment protein
MNECARTNERTNERTKEGRLTTARPTVRRRQSVGFFSAITGANRHEEAAELYERAATSFKLAKSWRRAADAYEALATCRATTKETHDAASAHVDCAQMLKKCGANEEAIGHYREASNAYARLGRLAQAAKHLKEIGETYESLGTAEGDERAVEAFSSAADLYDGEGDSGRTTGNNCKLKAATLLASKLDRFEEATEIFEDVGRASLNNNLLRFSVKGYFLQAGICRLCWNDAVGVLNACERYEESDPAFASSRERDLLVNCAKAFEAGDQDAFSSAVAEFDSMSRLDGWKTTMLLKAKKRIVAAVEAEEDDLT